MNTTTDQTIKAGTTVRTRSGRTGTVISVDGRGKALVIIGRQGPAWWPIDVLAVVE